MPRSSTPLTFLKGDLIEPKTYWLETTVVKWVGFSYGTRNLWWLASMNTDTSAHLHELKDHPKVAQSKKRIGFYKQSVWIRRSYRWKINQDSYPEGGWGELAFRNSPLILVTCPYGLGGSDLDGPREKLETNNNMRIMHDRFAAYLDSWAARRLLLCRFSLPGIGHRTTGTTVTRALLVIDNAMRMLVTLLSRVILCETL